MPELIFENSVLWLLPIVLLSALATWLLYFRGKGFTNNQRKVLAAFRFLIFVCLGILLLSPLLKSSELEEEKPILVWLEDHSRSMVLGPDSAEVKRSLASTDLLSQLEDRYQVEQVDFGKELTKASDSFAGTGTDLYEALSSVQERYYNQNVGGMVILSDGISNLGNNPAYAVQGVPYPVYSVGFGDTTSSSDMFIDRVVSNGVSYLNNNFPIEIYLKARQLSGSNYTLTVSDNSGKTLHTQRGTVSGADFFQRVDLFLKAEKVGLQQFVVSVSRVGAEENLDNNVRTFAVDVLNNQKKVSIIGSGPHPDMAAIANALKAVEKYEVKSYISADLPPGDHKADLYILHDPTASDLNLFLDDRNPVWIFKGPSTPAEALPEKTNVTFSSGAFEDVQAVINSSFNLFTLTDQEIEFAGDLPPLWSPFGETEINGTSYPLFTKKVGRVSTSEPLWFYTQTPDLRKAFTVGTGIWRWRIEDYRQQKSFTRFDGLITKTVQYLTTSRQERRFVVDISDRFDQYEAIRGEARLYNPSLELTNEPDLDITFTDEQNKTYDFSFSKTQNTYQLNAGKLPVGVYTWESEVSLGDENFRQAGSFIVEQSKLEESDLVARHSLLRNISRESGGEFVKAAEMTSLRNKLLNNTEAKSIQVLETNTASLINERWIFAIFLILMTLEWGLRKYFGNY